MKMLKSAESNGKRAAGAGGARGAAAKTRLGALPLAAAVAAVAVLAPAAAFGRDLLFLGVTDVRGALVQPELEAELRAEFAADGRYRLIGEVETERVVREMERRGHTRAEAVIPPGAGLADSTVIARGVVRDLSVVAKRSSLLLWGRIDARMRLDVSFVELSGRSPHRGEFGAAASKRKEVILFQDPKTAVHISAADREELLGRMRAKLVKDAAGLAAAYFNALSSGGAASDAPAGGADADGARTGDREFSTVDGEDVAPIGGAGAEGGGE